MMVTPQDIMNKLQDAKNKNEKRPSDQQLQVYTAQFWTQTMSTVQVM
jgi:hypothetical protein